MEFVIGLIVGIILTLVLEHGNNILRSYEDWRSKRIYENSLDLRKLK